MSKVRSLNLDKWDRTTVDVRSLSFLLPSSFLPPLPPSPLSSVQFMQAQGNTKSNAYYEARLGKGHYADTRKPPSNSSK